ncbi:MAG: 50S ribosomal protein L4 [Candidatus Onthovivens sp.]|nr:50S ribosomal protein L4 [Mollicutes bacterium]MDY4857608.1 50S ribosomal protein L4 [Candidatus Onthovivens sp.]MDY4936727.1 50S ribosomal protein L4 [Candidatus Onthovivens sp.]
MADMKLNVYNQNGEKVSTINVAKDVFGCEVNNQVMFDAVTVYMANLRQATAKTKNRSEVSGGGKKPFRQKGTGRARAGSTRSPIWVGGGNVFGPKGNQNFKIKQNKKEHNLALRSALSQLGSKNIYVLDEVKVNGKTSEVVALLKGLKLDNKKVLVVTSDDLVYRASANLANLVLRTNDNVSVYDLLNAQALLLNKEEVKLLEEGLK